jgi:hypothetical protein
VLSALWDRIRTNPVLVTAVVLAFANLLGASPDETLTAQIVESVVLLVSGVVTRLFTRSKVSLEDAA